MAFITEDRIWQLCTNAVEAKTLEDADYAVHQLRIALAEQMAFAKALLEAQLSNCPL